MSDREYCPTCGAPVELSVREPQAIASDGQPFSYRYVGASPVAAEPTEAMVHAACLKFDNSPDEMGFTKRMRAALRAALAAARGEPTA